MKRLIITSILLISLANFSSSAQIYVNEKGQRLMEMQVLTNGDTIYLANLHTAYCFPVMKFKNKKQEKFYWKTVRDVKKTLPYAKIVGKTLNQANDTLTKLPDDKARKAYLKQLEREVKKKYEPEMRKMTFSQGKMLIRLINRETEYTSYELIKMYRGTFTAMFWQGMARIFGTDLKQEYDGSDKDKIIERVIVLVEAGQL